MPELSPAERELISRPVLRVLTLADHAAVTPDDKLYIGGAGAQRQGLKTFPGALGQIYLAVVVAIPSNLAGEPHRVRIRYLDEDRTPIGPDGMVFEGTVETGRPPGLRAGEELDIKIALGLAGFPVEHEGLTFFHVEFDGELLGVLPLRLLRLEAIQGQGLRLG